jgi:hypothetical protein
MEALIMAAENRGPLMHASFEGSFCRTYQFHRHWAALCPNESPVMDENNIEIITRPATGKCRARPARNVTGRHMPGLNQAVGSNLRRHGRIESSRTSWQKPACTHTLHTGWQR